MPVFTELAKVSTAVMILVSRFSIAAAIHVPSFIFSGLADLFIPRSTGFSLAFTTDDAAEEVVVKPAELVAPTVSSANAGTDKESAKTVANAEAIRFVIEKWGKK